MNTELVIAPKAQPVSSEELVRHVWEIYDRENSDRTYFDELIERATAHVETITSRRLVEQTWRGYLQSWPKESIIELPYGRVKSITRFNWLGDDAVDHVMESGTDYIASLSGYFPKVVAKNSWPSGQLFVVDPIRIEFVAGFGSPADVPADLRHAILILAAHWYRNREIVRIGNMVSPLPQAFDALVGPWRITGV